jgi:phage tail-like protein
MILDGEDVRSKESIVSYAQKLIDSNLEIPYYNLQRLLNLHEINIESILFEESKKSNLSVLEISDIKDDSIKLVLSEKSWIEYLPSIYKNNQELKSFLYGIQVSMFKQRFIVDHIEDIFIPRKGEFLDWLASWYGVGFSSSVESDTKRELIYKLIDLYKRRGTVDYLVEMIDILTGAKVEIKERAIPKYLEKEDDFMQEEYNLKITFTVKILNEFNEKEEEKALIRSIRNILDKEKPAFTEYYIDSDLIIEESKGTGIDMKIEEKNEDFFDIEDEPAIDHYQHEKKVEEIKKVEKNKDNDDDFFLYD